MSTASSQSRSQLLEAQSTCARWIKHRRGERAKPKTRIIAEGEEGRVIDLQAFRTTPGDAIGSRGRLTAAQLKLRLSRSIAN